MPYASLLLPTHLVVIDGPVRRGVLQEDSTHVVSKLDVSSGQLALVDDLCNQAQAASAGLDHLDGLGVALVL